MKMDRDNYSRVTSVLSQYGPDFSMVANLDYYADRGTRVHDACMDISLGKWTPIDKDIRGYVDSFKRWFENVDEVVLAEERLYSDIFKISGQPDLICRLKNDKRIVLVDYKSPLSYHRVWSVQTGGYVLLVEEDRGIKVDRWGTLRLRKDGGIPLWNESPPDSIMAFISAIRIHNYMNAV
jgi:hypothetical protein